ncbi:rhomboid family intramembrane serine protease [Candidatus Hakubella thermalkaliphila]|nr:rhomboid family intramembrane serine protease [Candidatus Hakubella thermalkaliphila]
MSSTLPLRDTTPSRSFPIVNITLIGINILVFIYQLTLAKHALLQLVQAFGVVPQHYLSALRGISTEFFLDIGSIHLLLPLVSSMFLHGGWLHILGNMLYLWIFGDNVEDSMGHFRYLLFYLLSGTIAGLAHILTNPTSTVPTIGASGAIAGVLGAYFILFPRARVITLVPFGFFLHIIQLPALIFLGFWFVLQFLYGAFALTAVGRAAGGIAWWAHIGGFVAGMVLIFLFQKKRRRPRYQNTFRPW